MRRYFVFTTTTAGVIAISILLAGCGNKEARMEKKESTESLGTGIGGGLSWAVPSGWTAGPEKSMRMATYIIDPAGDDSDSAECAVFYFGAASGGTVQDNLARWAGQFEQPDGSNSMEKAEIDSITANGLKITTIDLSGDYLVSGAMMQVTGKKFGYRLLGAIVEGPEGSVFFKLTGPEKTVKSTKSGFDALLQSVKPKLA
jgi:hypothetical protein